MPEVRYLLDVNVLLALLSEDHQHHRQVTAWFDTPELLWALCSFTEAGFLRNAMALRGSQVSMIEATALLASITQHSGYRYQVIDAD